ncbi:MAG: glycosyltransferase family 39 protein [Chthoniobacterales bacterium]
MPRLYSLLIVMAVWALIYLPGLGTLEIKGEEGRRILPAVTMLQTGNYLVPQVGSDPYFTKPPLINWLVAAAFKLTGRHNEWSARLPSVLCVLAVALAFVAIGRRTLGASGSLIAAVVWMTNFGIVEKGRLIELEALYVSLTGLAFICWLSWWQERRSPWLTWTVPWIFLGLGMLAKGPLHLVFFYAVVIGVLVCVRREGAPAPAASLPRSRWSRPALGAMFHPAHLAGILIMLGLFAAWAIPCLQMMQGSDVAHTWTRQFSGRLSGEDFKLSGWIMNIPRGLGYFLPWTLLFLWPRLRRPIGFRNVGPRTRDISISPESSTFDVRSSAFDVSVGLAWGIGLSFLAVSLLPGSLARYTMPLLAPAAWLATLLLPKDSRLPRLVAAIVGVAMLIYGLALTPRLAKREKVRNIAAQLNAALPPNEPLYVVDPDYQPALFYVREPILYVDRVDQVPRDAHYFLLQPDRAGSAEASERWSPRRARSVLRLKDYRKKEVILFEIADGA